METFDEAYGSRQIEKSRSRVRAAVKNAYLKRILSRVDGLAIDFGCGAGQLLEKLPKGSVGIEVSDYLVSYLAEERRLRVVKYDPESDDFRFDMLETSMYSTFVMSHVLEHFDDAATVLGKIMNSCARLGVRRIIIVVPGLKGYASDSTHKTFVDKRFVIDSGLTDHQVYDIAKMDYFPIDLEVAGNYFIYNEMMLVFDRK